MIAQGIMIDMFNAGQNRSSIPKNKRYSDPVKVNDNNTAIAEIIAVCRIGDKLDMFVFIKRFSSGNRLNGYADAWLTRWYERISKPSLYPARGPSC